MRTTIPLVAVALVIGCGGGPKKVPVPSPPVVQVIPAAPVVVDTQFVVDVLATGCDALKSVELDDGTKPLARIESPSGTRVSFTVSRTGLDYAHDGIEAHLDLHATAVCNNGAQDTSPGVGMVFMPAAQSFPGTLPFSGLALDGSGRSVVGCVGSAVERLGIDGAVLQSTGTTLGFNCTASGYLLRGGTDELYWIEPGQNLARMSNALQVTPGAVYNESVGSAFLGPGGGPAVFFARDAAGMFWLDRATGQRLTPRLSLAGSIAGSAALSSGTLLVPESAQPMGSSKVNLQIERWNTATAT